MLFTTILVQAVELQRCKGIRIFGTGKDAISEVVVKITDQI